MLSQNRWTRWVAVLALGVTVGACADQEPTAAEPRMAPETAPSLSTAGSEIAQLIVSPVSYTLKKGQTKQMIAVPLSATNRILSLSGRTVSWSSSDAAIASVSSSGKVTARAGGTVTITATVDGKQARATITVLAPVSVAAIALTPSNPSVEVGKSVQLMAVPQDARGIPVSGYTVSWQSSNPAVAKVYSNGTVEAVAAGSVSITASAGGVSSSVTVTVTKPAPAPAPAPGGIKVTVVPGTVSLTVGQTKQMFAVVQDAAGKLVYGKTFTWSSSNPAVLSVSSTGKITAKAAGTATLTAQTDGVKGTAQVSVAVPF